MKVLADEYKRYGPMPRFDRDDVATVVCCFGFVGLILLILHLLAHEVRLTLFRPASIAAVCPRHAEVLTAGAVDASTHQGIKHITTDL